MKRRSISLGLKITSMAPGGDGVGHVEFEGERRAVFVPRSAMGDEIVADVDFSSRPARGHLTRITLPSKHRVAPPCIHASECGGCDLMHLTHGAQLAVLAGHVMDALREANVAALVPIVHPAKEREGVRVRARIHVESKRGGGVRAGFFAARTHDVVEISTCLALRPELDRVRAMIPALFDGTRGKGEVRLALGAGSSVVLDIAWDAALEPAIYARLEAAVKSGDLGGARVIEKGAARPAIIGDPSPVTQGADGAPLALAPGGFSQAIESAELGRVVVALATRALVGRAAPRIVELYAGSGNFTVALAQLGDVVAWESDAAACEIARKNFAARGIENAKITCADAAAYRVKERADLVVLDPPRTGAREVCERLVKEPARHVLYVSCDPQTLGRDARILASRYALVDVHVLECFPNTSHVETVLLFDARRDAARAKNAGPDPAPGDG